jgi:hypothetical protein
MKNFVKKRDKFLIVNAGVACLCYCGFNAVLIAQRKLELLNNITMNLKAYKLLQRAFGSFIERSLSCKGKTRVHVHYRIHNSPLFYPALVYV